MYLFRGSCNLHRQDINIGNQILIVLQEKSIILKSDKKNTEMWIQHLNCNSTVLGILTYKEKLVINLCWFIFLREGISRRDSDKSSVYQVRDVCTLKNSFHSNVQCSAQKSTFTSQCIEEMSSIVATSCSQSVKALNHIYIPEI